MKFRRGILVLVAVVLLLAYFTKPSRETLMAQMQSEINRAPFPPVIDFQDKFLYINVLATYVDAGHPLQSEHKLVAPAHQTAYIGLFGRFWKVNP